MPANMENSAVATGLEKVSFHSNPKERQCQRMSNYLIIALISHTTKVMFKILQARFQQYVNHALLITQKPLTVWITTNYGKFLKRLKYQTAWPVSWEICIQDKKQQLECDIEQWTGSKLGKGYIKVVYCHSAYLTSMQSTYEECRAG